MSKDSEMKYTHLIFVQEYLVDFNGKQAYMRVYPNASGETAQSSSSVLLAREDIQKAIEEGTQDKIKRVRVTQDKVLNELGLLAFSDMRNYVDFGPVGVTLKEMSQMPPELTRAIAKVSHNLGVEGGGSVEFKLHDKRPALVDIGKHLGLFPNKTELELPKGLTITIDSDDANHG